MSGRIAKSQIPIRSRSRLPSEASSALITAKNVLKAGGMLSIFHNNRHNKPKNLPPPLPEPTLGCVFLEADAGEARPGDLMGQRGRWRFIFEFNPKSREILTTYYTQHHYDKFTFERLE